MRQLRDIVLKLDNEYGKLSPLNNISNLEMILRRCQGNKADLLWFFQHLSFVLEAAILGPRDVTVRALDQPRSAGSSGLVALFLAKKKILAHFLESVLADVKATPDCIKLANDLASHDAWKEKVGAGKIAVDISWQGALSESERKIIAFMSLIFTDQLDSSLRSSLKATNSPEEILGHSPFSNMIEEITSLVKKETGVTQSEIDKSVELNRPAPGDADMCLEDLVTPELLQEKADDLEELSSWFKAATTKVDQFLKFTPYEASVMKLTDQLKGTFLSGEREQVGLWFDSSRMGEASTQPHVRVPRFNQRC